MPKDLVMSRYVLRTSQGPYSSGTEVELFGYAGQSDIPSTGVVVVFPLCETTPDAAFDCAVEDLVKRRKRTFDIPSNGTRRGRRVGLNRKSDV